MVSWPPTPAPPSSIEDAEATLRQGAPGPPPFGDDDPWDFIHRWPDDVVATLVWPAVSRLLEDADPEVRERAIWFCKRWPVEPERSLARLLEVATSRADLFRDVAHVETLAVGLADLSSSSRTERPRAASLILALLGEAPPCRGGVSLIAQQDPAALVARAPRWGEGLLDQIAAREAVSAMAMYRPDHLLALLGALRSRTAEQRREILVDLTPRLAMSAEHRALIVTAEGLPLPQRPCPTIDECRRALGVSDESVAPP